MARTPTMAGRFGGEGGVCPPSVRDWNYDTHPQKTLDRRTEQVIKARIALIASAIIALIALALATRVAAQPFDAFTIREQICSPLSVAEGLTPGS